MFPVEFLTGARVEAEKVGVKCNGSVVTGYGGVAGACGVIAGGCIAGGGVCGVGVCGVGVAAADGFCVDAGVRDGAVIALF